MINGCALVLHNFSFCQSSGPMVQHYCHWLTISIHPCDKLWMYGNGFSIAIVRLPKGRSQLPAPLFLSILPAPFFTFILAPCSILLFYCSLLPNEVLSPCSLLNLPHSPRPLLILSHSPCSLNTPLGVSIVLDHRSTATWLTGKLEFIHTWHYFSLLRRFSGECETTIVLLAPCTFPRGCMTLAAPRWFRMLFSPYLFGKNLTIIWGRRDSAT